MFGKCHKFEGLGTACSTPGRCAPCMLGCLSCLGSLLLPGYAITDIGALRHLEFGHGLPCADHGCFHSSVQERSLRRRMDRRRVSGHRKSIHPYIHPYIDCMGQDESQLSFPNTHTHTRLSCGEEGGKEHNLMLASLKHFHTEFTTIVSLAGSCRLARTCSNACCLDGIGTGCPSCAKLLLSCSSSVLPFRVIPCGMRGSRHCPSRELHVQLGGSSE